MRKFKTATFLFLGIFILMFSSCGKSYKSSENSIPIDVYLNGPMRLAEDKIERNDSLAILLNLINGRMPQLNFHRLDLGDSIFRDTIQMGFFNSLFEEFIDIYDMQEDLNSKVFGSDLRAFLTAPRGGDFKELDSLKQDLPIDSVLLNKGESQRAILEKMFIKNGELNKGRILISFLPSNRKSSKKDSITPPNGGGSASLGESDSENLRQSKDSDEDGVIDEIDNCKDVYGSKEDGGCPGIGTLIISNGGAVSWSGTADVGYLSIRYSTAPDKEIMPTKEVKKGDKIQIPGVQNTNDKQFYFIKYGRSKGNLKSEITVKCSNFL